MNNLSLGEAIALMRDGKKVAREGWNGKGMYLALQTPDEQSMNKQPYVYIVPAEGQRIPWTCSQADLLANDFFEVTE